MRAVWRTARFAIRRRRLQTSILGAVLMISTATAVLAVGLLVTVDGPFDRAFKQVAGAHLTVIYDADTAPDRLAGTGTSPGVIAAGGPYPVMTVNVPDGAEEPVPDDQSIAFLPGPLTVVGRTADDAARVDRLTLTRGRWPSAPGEVALSSTFLSRFHGFDTLGKTVRFTEGRSLKVVGVVRSVTASAQGWVLPADITAPTGYQMLYRLTDPDAPVSSVAGDLPVAGSQNYTVARLAATERAKTAIPFLVAFGAAGLLVAVLIIGNVVSGAVVSGFRHIGVLKALGFTPAQVTGVYLVMIAVPGMLGSLVGIVIGNLLAGAITSTLGDSLDLPAASGVSVWVDLGALLGVLTVIVVTALVPAVRAGRIPAAVAVSAGSAPRRGRGLRVQRALAMTRLPRTVSLGLGLPFARPGRTLLTISAVALGVAAVTFAVGLNRTIFAYNDDGTRASSYQLDVIDRRGAGPGTVPIADRPGTAKVGSGSRQTVGVTGVEGPVQMKAYEGDVTDRHGHRLIKGRWLTGPGEAVVGAPLLRASGTRVGDVIGVEAGGRSVPLKIVGLAILESDNALLTSWASATQIFPSLRVTIMEITLKPGTSVSAYDAALKADGYHTEATGDHGGQEGGEVVLLALIAALTLGIAAVAGLGVFNTVVLNTHDRARDFGILKSLGATPRQVLSIVVVSMAALGLAGGLIGLPLGTLARAVVLPKMAEPGGVLLPYTFTEIYPWPWPAGFALAGPAIAVLGSLVPAGWAARIKTASALRSE
ncbi:FtsX-like permease family protein [Actinocorallia longicatena]|uniref:ABC transport system permease protein n=1 Tax=Actinocorallia longicatena TaxID=111803 RepID=A0ABP6QC65_9ACTN